MTYKMFILKSNLLCAYWVCKERESFAAIFCLDKKCNFLISFTLLYKV